MEKTTPTQQTRSHQELIRNIILGSVAGTLLYILITSILFDDQFDQYIFRFHIDDIYPYFLILGIIMILFSLVLFYRSYRRGHTSLFILTFAVFLAGLSYVFGFLNFDPTGTINFRQTRLFQVQILSQTISVFFLFLHYELSSHPRPRTGFLATTLLLLWPYSFLNMYYLIFDNYNSDGFLGQVEIVSLVLLQIGIIIIFGWLLYNSIKTSRIFFNRSGSVRNAVSIQLAGIVILVTGVVFQLIETITPLDVWHTPLNTIAILLVALPYLQNPNIIVFSPINIMMLGVVDEIGRTMYFEPVDEEFANDRSIKSSSELFGGLTLAFSSMGKEVAKSEKGVDSLQFGDRSIVVEFMEPYYLVVIANRSTFFLEKEMEEYLTELRHKFPQVPKDGSIIPKDVFHELNKRFFPIIITNNL